MGNDYLDDTSKQLLCTILQSRDSRQPYDNNTYFSMQERKALLVHYRASNQKLAVATGADLEEPVPRIPAGVPHGMESTTMAVDTDAAVRLLIDICLEQHYVPWYRTMGGLLGPLNNKLKQYIPW